MIYIHEANDIMSNFKRLKLRVHKKPKRVSLNAMPIGEIYFSGYCATDNKNFALFGVNEQFLIDKGFDNVLNFELSENDLWMLIDRGKEIQPEFSLSEITFPLFGTVKRIYFDIVTQFNPEMHFFPITEWFGKTVNRLIACLPDKDGKPVGLLKTIAIKEDKIE